MRIFLFAALAIATIACDDTDENEARRLARVERVSYTGEKGLTKYEYDRADRIVAIKESRADQTPVVIATIRYEGNEAVILSAPDFDPSYNQTTEVRLKINSEGLTEKRIEYTHRVAVNQDLPAQVFVYDTTIFEYTDGLLTEKTNHRYDSARTSETRNSVVRSTSVATYTIEGGNVTAVDETVVYPRVTRDGPTTIVSGGSSVYHTEFNYFKSYPNKTDFKNAAVLNEYKQSFEPFLNPGYKNMPDQTITNLTDKDHEGVVIFNITTVIDMERSYNNDGLLSSMKIPANTQYRETAYFYE